MLSQKIWRKLRRGPQIITLKDAGLISAFTGLQSGDSVVDAGAGSGFLAIYLASIVAPAGKVSTYERNEVFAGIAKKNTDAAGLAGVVKLKEKDVFLGIDEKEVDLITLDLAEPERLLAPAKEALKMHGFLVAYLPHTEQVKALVLAAEKEKFMHVRTIESSVREWLIREYGCRPGNTGIVFTGFLVFLQKVEERDFEEARRALEDTKQGRRARRVKERLR